MLSVAQYCCRFIAVDHNFRKNNVLKFSISAIFVLIVVLGLNNMYNYLDFGYQFNWHNDINYMMFLVDDITYHVGLGWLRYPIVLLAYTLIYLGTYYRVVYKGIKKLKRLLIEILSEDEKQEG